MFNLFAYIGNYVTLYEDDLTPLGCYQVTLDTYDPLKTYEHFYLSSGYSPNLVGVYGDCGCSGRTSFQVVQQSACTTNYFWYTGLSCSDSATTYTFKSEDANLLSGTTVYKIENSGTTQDICVFNTNPTFVQQTDWIQILSAFTTCELCNYVVPTPTPTNTPTIPVTPTNTPTPSFTPTPTPTRVCPQCVSYRLNASEDGTWTWTNCDGIDEDVYLYAGESYTILCSFPGALEGTVNGIGTYTLVQNCYPVCPTATPTNTTTTTNTPSPTPTSATTYTSIGTADKVGATTCTSIGTTPEIFLDASDYAIYVANGGCISDGAGNTVAVIRNSDGSPIAGTFYFVWYGISCSTTTFKSTLGSITINSTQC